MIVNLKMLIVANMDLITAKELGSGLTLQLGNRDHYVIEIVEKSGIINILKQRNACHKKPKPTGNPYHSFTE